MSQETTNTRQAALTKREQEVLRFVARGWRNRRIVEALDVSEVTVRFHLRNIYDKLGVESRTQAAVWAIRFGLDGEPGQNPIGTDG